jgi:hypothetical protein
MKKCLSILFASIFFVTLSSPTIAAPNSAVTSDIQFDPLKCPPLC